MEAQKMDGLKIVELVCLYQMYYSETQNENLKSFSAWLSKNAEGNNAEDEQTSEDIMNINIIDLFIRISKFIKLFHKDIFNHHQIKTYEEYKFLLTIKNLENPAKSDVYTHTVTELTTGAKIMKRLIEMGFVKEFDDKLDKRIKRVKLTPKGQKELKEVEETIHVNNEKILSYTPENEKTNLMAILSLINGYHTDLYRVNPEKFLSL
jgi:MarR family transcriptional regulator, lower aerobic nicotinate degradation pathway regulator